MLTRTSSQCQRTAKLVRIVIFALVKACVTWVILERVLLRIDSVYSRPAVSLSHELRRREISLRVPASKVLLQRLRQVRRTPGVSLSAELSLHRRRRNERHGRTIDDKQLSVDVLRGGRGQE